MEQTTNAILVQNVSWVDIERMIRSVVREEIQLYEQKQQTATTLIKRKEAAVLLSVSLPTLDAYARIGLLHSRHIGGRVYFVREEVQSLIIDRVSCKHVAVPKQQPFT